MDIPEGGALEIVFPDDHWIASGSITTDLVNPADEEPAIRVNDKTITISNLKTVAKNTVVKVWLKFGMKEDQTATALTMRFCDEAGNTIQSFSQSWDIVDNFGATAANVAVDQTNFFEDDFSRSSRTYLNLYKPGADDGSCGDGATCVFEGVVYDSDDTSEIGDRWLGMFGMGSSVRYGVSYSFRAHT